MRLLVLSCSQRKRPDAGLAPAMERYDGPAFRVVRRFMSSGQPAGNVDVWILSAKFGFLHHDEPIPNYDQPMSARRSLELRPLVGKALANLIEQNDYRSLGICAGGEYLRTLQGFDLRASGDLNVEIMSGGQGAKLAALHRWLYTDSVAYARAHAPAHTNPSQDLDTALMSKGYTPATSTSISAPGQANCKNVLRIRGMEVTATVDQVLAVARRAREMKLGDPDNYHAWYVLVDDQRVAPKWLVSQVTGLQVSAFNTSDALRLLTGVGIEVKRA